MPDRTFNSAALLAGLHAYRPLDAEDDETRRKIIEFVVAHPDYYRRSLLAGHVTGAAWVADPSHRLILLTHHAKLDRWLQLGGHVEEDASIQDTALREAREESGLVSFELHSPEIFDVDIHPIPETPKALAHFHYDIRFFFTADPSEPLKITAESKSLAWVPVDKIDELTKEWSVLRMREKMRAPGNFVST